MNTGTYKPALKRRRLSSNRSHHCTQVQTFNHSHGTHRSNSNPSHHVAPNESVTAFKSQLKEVFELFPPFADFVSSQQHPQQSFQSLYQVFVSCTPPAQPHQPTYTNHALQTPSVVHRPPTNPRRFNQHLTANPKQIQCTKSVNVSSRQLLATQPQNEIPSESKSPSKSNTNTFFSQIPPPMDDVKAIPATDIDPTDPMAIFTEAKERMIRIANRNMEIRCNKIVQSLNHTTRNDAKYCAFLKQFTLNEAVKMNIVHRVTNTLRPWEGGSLSPVQKRDELTRDDAFKLVRAHWNRQKAQQLGDTLFAVVLRNIFKTVLQIPELSRKEQVLFYIHLFRGLLSDRVQFEQSMPRPVVPHACFDKASGFKRLCENILDSFSRGVVSMMRIKTVQTYQENGRKVTKYIKNRNRSKSLANAYDNCLQHVENMVSNSTKEFLQHSIQLHLNCMQRNCYSDCELVQWKKIPPIGMNRLSFQPWIDTNE